MFVCLFPAVCSQGCIHGTCSSPNKCTCDAGYSGATCDTITCQGGCVNGQCVMPNVCHCANGWTGADCTQRKYHHDHTRRNGHGLTSKNNICYVFFISLNNKRLLTVFFIFLLA